MSLYGYRGNHGVVSIATMGYFGCYGNLWQPWTYFGFHGNHGNSLVAMVTMVTIEILYFGFHSNFGDTLVFIIIMATIGILWLVRPPNTWLLPVETWKWKCIPKLQSPLQFFPKTSCQCKKPVCKIRYSNFCNSISWRSSSVLVWKWKLIQWHFSQFKTSRNGSTITGIGF